MSNSQPFRILVICTGDRARLQIAHGWLEHIGGGCVRISSAGTEPKGVHPIAIRVMNEVGIDIAYHSSDHVDRYLGDDFDLALTVCDSARESCPVFPGAERTLHRSFEDPDFPDLSQAELTEVFRRIRDDIGALARDLLTTELG